MSDRETGRDIWHDPSERPPENVKKQRAREDSHGGDSRDIDMINNSLVKKPSARRGPGKNIEDDPIIAAAREKALRRQGGGIERPKSASTETPSMTGTPTERTRTGSSSERAKDAAKQEQRDFEATAAALLAKADEKRLKDLLDNLRSVSSADFIGVMTAVKAATRQVETDRQQPGTKGDLLRKTLDGRFNKFVVGAVIKQLSGDKKNWEALLKILQIVKGPEKKH